LGWGDIVGALEDLAAKGRANAELDSKCINYAISLGPDDLEEFQKLIGTVQVEEVCH
jgi:hypothetical protein